MEKVDESFAQDVACYWDVAQIVALPLISRGLSLVTCLI